MTFAELSTATSPRDDSPNLATMTRRNRRFRSGDGMGGGGSSLDA